MKKINVIGTTGSGKSTFSKNLATALDIPYIQMDQVFWKPNWEEPTDKEFFPKLSLAMSQEAWVLDGNYSRTNQIKWKETDTIIWLDFSYIRTLFQLLRRTITRAIRNEELWPNTGNRESFYKSFFTKKSIILWFFKNYNKNRKRYLALMKSPKYSHIHFIHLQSPEEAEVFIEEHRIKTNAAAP